MQLTLNEAEFRSLSQASQDELIARLAARRERGAVDDDQDMAIDPAIDMDDVVGLSAREIKVWMEKASDKTKDGLRVFAEKGPVIHAKDLTAAGIDNVSHFQSRVTIRTRTVTGERDAYLFGWDDWSEAEDGEGRYAVSPETYRSLRQYFRID